MIVFLALIIRLYREVRVNVKMEKYFIIQIVLIIVLQEQNKILIKYIATQLWVYMLYLINFLSYLYYKVPDEYIFKGLYGNSFGEPEIKSLGITTSGFLNESLYTNCGADRILGGPFLCANNCKISKYISKM